MHYHHHHLTLLLSPICGDDDHGDDGEYGDDDDQPGPFRLPLRDWENDFLNLPTGSNECLTDWNFKAKSKMKWNLADKAKTQMPKWFQSDPLASIESIHSWICSFISKNIFFFYQNEHQSLTFVHWSPAPRQHVVLQSGIKSLKHFWWICFCSIEVKSPENIFSMNMLFLLLLPGHQDTVVGITVVRLSISRLIGENDLSKIK